MRKIEKLILGILAIAGINWGLWAIFDLNLVEYFFNKDWIKGLVYFIFGVCGVYYVFTWKNWLGKRK